jgi:hypothetical protein
VIRRPARHKSRKSGPIQFSGARVAPEKSALEWLEPR